MPVRLHIQHNTTPHTAEAALSLLRFEPNLDPYEFATRIGVADSVATKLILPALRQMGILSGVSLAPFGNRLALLQLERPELIGEALHLRLATLHHGRPGSHFSFAYEAIGDWLWDRGDYIFKDEARSELVGVVIDRAARTFEVDAGGIAFSKTSINGASHWLAATDPPALDRDTDRFKRRHSTPAFSVLWAIDALYRTEGLAWGTRLSLSEAHTMRLCQWLMLEPDALPAVLTLCGRTEGGRKTPGENRWLSVGSEGGYGRWLVLAAPCPVGAIQVPLPEDMTESNMPFEADKTPDEDETE